MRLVYELRLSDATPSNNELKNMHFRVYKKLREDWRSIVAAALDHKLPTEPIDRAALEIERYCAGGGLDWDNAYGGLKPMLDCLVTASTRNPDGLGLIQDDSPKFMPEAPKLKQMPAKKGAGYTVVRIYSLEN